MEISSRAPQIRLPQKLGAIHAIHGNERRFCLRGPETSHLIILCWFVVLIYIALSFVATSLVVHDWIQIVWIGSLSWKSVNLVFLSFNKSWIVVFSRRGPQSFLNYFRERLQRLLVLIQQVRLHRETSFFYLAECRLTSPIRRCCFGCGVCGCRIIIYCGIECVYLTIMHRGWIHHRRIVVIAARCLIISLPLTHIVRSFPRSLPPWK